jgi:hypothetical protein
MKYNSESAAYRYAYVLANFIERQILERVGVSSLKFADALAPHVDKACEELDSKFLIPTEETSSLWSIEFDLERGVSYTIRLRSDGDDLADNIYIVLGPNVPTEHEEGSDTFSFKSNIDVSKWSHKELLNGFRQLRKRIVQAIALGIDDGNMFGDYHYEVEMVPIELVKNYAREMYEFLLKARFFSKEMYESEWGETYDSIWYRKLDPDWERQHPEPWEGNFKGKKKEFEKAWGEWNIEANNHDSGGWVYFNLDDKILNGTDYNDKTKQAGEDGAYDIFRRWRNKASNEQTAWFDLLAEIALDALLEILPIQDVTRYTREASEEMTAADADYNDEEHGE